VFWVISVYFSIRNTLPKSGTFLLGHPVYGVICITSVDIYAMMCIAAVDMYGMICITGVDECGTICIAAVDMYGMICITAVNDYRMICIEAVDMYGIICITTVNMIVDDRYYIWDHICNFSSAFFLFNQPAVKVHSVMLY